MWDDNFFYISLHLWIYLTQDGQSLYVCAYHPCLKVRKLFVFKTETLRMLGAVHKILPGWFVVNRERKLTLLVSQVTYHSISMNPVSGQCTLGERQEYIYVEGKDVRGRDDFNGHHLMLKKTEWECIIQWLQARRGQLPNIDSSNFLVGSVM